MPGPQKWVTMGDVARHAGVGKITVSRALRTPSKVSHDTLARVQAAVAELGYVRDETAGALSSQRSRIVGALVSTLEQTVFASTLRGLEEGLRHDGLQLLLASTEYDPATEATLISTLLGRRPDALVLTSSTHTPAARRLLENAGLPIFELWELPDQPVFAAVGFSNRAAMRDMTQHLKGTGRRNIAFLRSARPHDARADLRQQGYVDVVSDSMNGPRIMAVPVTPDQTGSPTGTDAGARGLAEILERWPDTDAVVCVSDALAFGAWCEALRRGIAVPGALAITGFGDVDFAGPSGINLTTVQIDGHAIGARAAEMICAACAPPANAPSQVPREQAQDAPQIADLGYHLMLRGTG